MSYDPDFPATNAELVSAAFRTQFQGLKALIDALQSLTGAVVDGVNTLNPGEPASVAIQVVGSELRFTFGIPRGNDGGQGPPGSDGGPGPAGPQGPPFASAVVDGVSTLDPGNSATVESTFDGSNVHFTFGIPRGNDGTQGPEGPQGPPGDVSAAQLNDAIATTSANSNAVSTLDAPFTNEPPTLADLETLRGKVNELILALRRG